MAFVNKTASQSTNMQELPKGTVTYVRYETSQPGQILAEGTYIGMNDKTRFGKAEYQFRDTNGNVMILNGAGHLDKNLPNVAKVGDYTQIVLRSKDKLTKGPFAGKSSYLFDILVDADRYREVTRNELVQSKQSA